MNNNVSKHEAAVLAQIGSEWISVYTLVGHGAGRTVNRLISKGLVESKTRTNLTEPFMVRRHHHHAATYMVAGKLVKARSYVEAVAAVNSL
jgi:hypothetical protein